ncbi:P1 family peptidase [Draconibacterium halophilum]|uniref:ATP-grasp domain-containing protein n=1 Tax=Draconibacterium halophilum TaxID=2706887 RepID=A0A6C0RJJ5_9BACT|nr:P1 family peptidase [Draconibacterium halophilum]QIA09351.1 ATP-grasp domain-containing protein [Draconibacterium halophilum]
MRITIAYNLRTDTTEATAELLSEEDINRISSAITSLQHTVTVIEVSGKPNAVLERLIESEPDLIFNLAEGTIGSSREAFYPGLYEQMGIPFTGGNASLLHLNLDKHLAKTVLASRGVKVPQGVLITDKERILPDNLNYPLIIKPNSEGSSKGISQDSVVETPEQALDRINKLLSHYPAGLVVEEFIGGRELSVPFIESFPGKLLDIVEHTFDLGKVGGKYNIYDYDMKQGGEAAKAVSVICPARISSNEEKAVIKLARDVFDIMSCPDVGRVDIRLHTNGQPYFIELNPLPSLHPAASLMTAAKSRGLEFRDVMRLIIRSAARRYEIPVRSAKQLKKEEYISELPRPTARELGITIGRMPPGVQNAITDVKGVRVGHLSRIEDNVQIPGEIETSSIRTGVTAILPAGQTYANRLAAGGFILNGVGEMAGLTQVIETGWLESPILLTNSHSVGRVHAGVISQMLKKYPQLGTKTDVVLPVVGEADDSFLNDVRIGNCSSRDVVKAIESASSGAVTQGSVGAGTGMTTFDFAGGVGTSSRILNLNEKEPFTVGVLVLSNFGKMRNLTIDGGVIGRQLDKEYPTEGRREVSEGSIIVVVATDIPLISSQLNRVAKRAALGVGRTGSYAAATSGEIIIAFSTGNRKPRQSSSNSKFITLKSISDAHINSVYEATIEATEEAIINSIFCSNGMSGREQRWCPPFPHARVIEILNKGN